NNADDGVGGSVSISAGNADTPGVLNLASGSKPSRESSTLELAPNAIVLRTGYSSNMYQPTGRIELSTGMSEGQSGQIQISTGSGNSSGSINISTSYANAAGTINITVGTSEVSTSGGEINITAGDTGESVEEGYGGRITISGGNGTNSVSSYGGSIQIYPGQGSALEKDGIVEFGFRSGSIEITPSLSITINGFAGNGGQVLTSQGTGNAVVWSGPYISIAQLQDILNNSSNFSDFKAAILAL
ncbi:MAG: hypothetical protein N2235_01575, partial [Fischerella sp.]|nr:hypothetical protein [Fischerella sp.]